MSKPITKAEAIRLLEQAVEQRGATYVDKAAEKGLTCKYVKGNKPSCIVGTALYNLGVPLKVLRAIDKGVKMEAKPFGLNGVKTDVTVGVGVHHPKTKYGKDALDYVEQETGITFVPAARAALSQAQSSQDDGESWGRAVRLAKRASTKRETI